MARGRCALALAAAPFPRIDVTLVSSVSADPRLRDLLIVIMTLRRGLCFLVLCLSASGCGGGTKPPAPPENLVPASGTVKLGGKPTAGVAIKILPTGSTKGQGGWAISDASGNFKIMHATQKEGIEPGDYRAVFSLFMTPAGEPLPPNTSPTMTMSVQAIPAPWSDPGSVAMAQSFSVPASGKTDMSFELPAPKIAKK